jgi:hypothetical protein
MEPVVAPPNVDLNLSNARRFASRGTIKGVIHELYEISVSAGDRCRLGGNFPERCFSQRGW